VLQLVNGKLIISSTSQDLGALGSRQQQQYPNHPINTDAAVLPSREPCTCNTVAATQALPAPGLPTKIYVSPRILLRAKVM